MGQRLNIEIMNGETSLANCYYHWDAYSFSSLKLVQKIIETHSMYKIFGYSNDLLMAVKILQSTGAGITDEERARIEKESDKYSGIKFNKAVGRNEGFISVTENGKASTRSWEEGRVTIDISSETFFFDVYCLVDKSDYEEMFSNETHFDELEICSYDFSSRIPFSEIDNLLGYILDTYHPMRYHDDDVILWIS